MTETTTVGVYTIRSLPDGAADLPTWAMNPDLAGGELVDWAAYAQRSPQGFHGEHHLWRIHNTCFLVEGEGHRILVDLGVGVGPYPWYQGIRGQLTQRMDAAGIKPAAITQVFLTHAHPDHVGWAFDEEHCVPRFPNARYRLHRTDWHFFADRDTVPRHFTRFVEPLAKFAVLDLLDGETTIAPGITALETPGHTAGHMSLLIESGGEGMIIAGDVLNSPMFVTEPHRPFGSDADQQQGIQTRIRLMDRITREGWRVAAAHFPTPGWGAIHLEAGRHWWRGG